MSCFCNNDSQSFIRSFAGSYQYDTPRELLYHLPSIHPSTTLTHIFLSDPLSTGTKHSFRSLRLMPAFAVFPMSLVLWEIIKALPVSPKIRPSALQVTPLLTFPMCLYSISNTIRQGCTCSVSAIQIIKNAPKQTIGVKTTSKS